VGQEKKLWQIGQGKRYLAHKEIRETTTGEKMPSCFLYSILFIRNSSKLSCALNAIEPESGAKKPLHRSTGFAGHSVVSGTITALARAVSSPHLMIPSSLVLSSENSKGFRKIGDDS
jgi:hypothetical protein